MARHKPPGEGKISRIDSESVQKKSAEKIKEYYERQLQRPEVKRPARREAERARPDQFRRGSALPRFMKSVQKRIDSTYIYRSFKLPGTDYLVRDLRDQEARDAEAAKKRPEFELKEGKLKGLKGKDYVNYLAELQGLKPEAAAKAAKEISRLLSEFEKLLVARFEKGKTVEKKSEDGKPHFLAKSGAQWKSFFSKFLKRTIWKKGKLSSIQDFIFRGLVLLKKGNGKYAMLIGDMAMADGSMDKFARLRVLAELSKLLANMKPGSTLEAEQLRRALGEEGFRYLALAHKHGERAIKTGAETTKGMFGELRTEEEVAKRLGLKGRKKGRGYGGPIKWGMGGEEEKKHAFVPWGFWEREERKGKPIVLTAIIFTIVAFLIFAAIWAVLRYLL